MNTSEIKKLSKFLSLILRHQPEIVHLKLDREGWADVEELLAKSQTKGIALDHSTLKEVVENNDKKRFSFSPDFRKIRASQGHSIEINLGFTPKEPPLFLFHGTAIQNISSIKEKGLVKGKRHHVHLSAEEETARKVGMRYGKPVVLQIQSGKMHQDGIEFYQSENGVWLTEKVPKEYIEFND